MISLATRILLAFAFAVGSAAFTGLSLFATSQAWSAPAPKPADPNPTHSSQLKVYFIDVEGGQSTLFVTPAGQSLLIDTGWPSLGPTAPPKDAAQDGSKTPSSGIDRIAAAVKDAGLTRIDYVLITHYHADHVGGVPLLLERVPVGAFIDHGPNRELDKGFTERMFAAYEKATADGHYKRILARPGDVLPMAGITATIISSDGNLLPGPLDGAGGPNPFCAASEVRPADQTENLRSVGVLIAFGKLKLLDLGDLTWDKEMELMCPVNKLGTVGVYIVSHHGWNQSSSLALVDAIHARVAIMDNGEKKGGSVPTLDTVAKAPGLETLWQLHYSAEGGEAHNTAAEYIANPLGPDAGYGIELVGAEDGSFDVVNLRTKVVKHYSAGH